MTFECEETRRYVDAWVDGELDPGASLHVETHVSRCGQCSAEAETIRSLKRVLGSTRETDRAPTAFRIRIAQALNAEDEACRDRVRAAQKRKHGAGFLLAGAAVAGFIVATGRHTSTHDEPFVEAGFVPPVVKDIADHHARYLPPEVQGNQPEQVANFFRNRLDIPVRPVAFRGLSAQFVGARISNVRDHMAAQLFYEVGGRHVTVFVFDGALVPRQNYGSLRRTTVGNNQSVYIGNAHGYTVAVSERDGVGYAVASDLPAQDTIRILGHAEIQ